MRSTLKGAAAAVGLLGLLASGPLLARDCHGGHPPEDMAGFAPPSAMHLVRELDLSGTQRDRVFAIADRYQPDIRKLVFSMHDARQALRGILSQGKLDEARVRQEAAAQAQAAQALYVTTAKMLSEMSAVLTPEQRAELAAAHERHGGRHHPPRGQ